MASTIKPQPTLSDLAVPHLLKRQQSMTTSTVALPVLFPTVRFSHAWISRVAWVLVVLAHVGIVVAYSHEAYIDQYILLGSRTEMAVQLLGLGSEIRRDIGSTLLTTNVVLMAWHAVGAFHVVSSSLWYRSFVYRFRWFSLLWTRKTVRRRRASATRSTAASSLQPPKRGLCFRVKRGLLQIWRLYRSTGVRGRHFNIALDIRECIEIISQTIQAYNISYLITNDSVIHFVAIILVLNCWSTPLLRLLFHHDEPKKRLFCLIFDAVFDFCCALAIPFLTFKLWEDQVATYNTYDPVWLIRSSSLLQFNLVNSWTAVLTTRLPALGLIIAMETIKSSLHRHSQTPPTTANMLASSQMSERDGAKLDSVQAASETSPGPTNEPPGLVTSKLMTRTSKLFDVAFLIYGLVILVLYASAMTKPRIDQPGEASNCILQLRPWGMVKNQVGCAVVDIDCARLGIAGSSGDLTKSFGAFDVSIIASVTFANCPALEIPPIIQQLRALLRMEVYNSTLARWESDAELNRAYHPRLTGLFFVRVSNLTTLPRGLLSPNFPPSLRAIEITHSDLTTLPESEIGSLWPSTLFVFVVEHSKLASFPSVLLTKTVTQKVSFAGNKLQSVPASAVFSSGVSPALWLSTNPISAFTGDDAPSVGSRVPAGLHISGTSLTDIPAWLLGAYERGGSKIFAKDTSLCPSASTAIDCDTSPLSTFPLEIHENLRIVRQTSTV